MQKLNKKAVWLMSKAVCRSQYCDPFIIHIVVHNAVHKSKL